MSRKVSTEQGFSAVEAIIVLVVIVVIGLAGWLVWQHHHQQKKAATSSSTTTQTNKQSSGTQTTDPYAGWKTATSAMAGFSIKYPTGWTYNSIMGKDNAEHITLDSAHMHLTIDSYSNQTATTCPDCSQVISSSSFAAPKLGTVDLKTVIYKLDSGVGNALILELPDSTYYLPSKDVANVSTTFRGISVLDSEQAYQAETPGQFATNPDYATTQKILESLTY